MTVVVTGLGLKTSLGNNVSTVWKHLLSKKSGIIDLGSDYAHLPCTVGGWVEKTKDQRYSPFILFALDAAHEAILDANLQDVDPERIGVSVGSGIGCIQETMEQIQLYKQNPKKLSPFWIPKILTNMASGAISMKYGYQGPNHSVSTACASGAHSIGDAFRFISSGDADVMIAGGSEASLSPLSIAGFAKARSLATVYESPQEASRPFDEKRNGFVMGEGAGIVVLESLEHAKARNAKIYAHLVGYGMSSDAFHITAPPPDGKGAALAMKNALRNAKLEPKDIDYINAHATSTQIGDLAEARAIHSVFNRVLVSSTKGATGHLLGAAGAVEAIFSILALHHQMVPPTLNLRKVSSDFPDLDYVQETRKTSLNAVLSNSFGFGGTNTSLAFVK